MIKLKIWCIMQKRSSNSKEIYLHIGLHKTGTSFFQKEIFPKLKDVDVKFKKKLIYDMSSYSDKPKVLFTDEDYSVSLPHQIHKYECMETLTNLKKLYPDAKIIIGLRNKIKWLHSCYYQYVASGGGFLSYKKYLEKYEDDILDFVVYLTMIRLLWKSVYVYNFEDFVDDPDKIVGELCNFMGCEIPQYKNRKYNISMNNTQIFLLRLMNRILTLNGRLPGYKILEYLLRLLRKPEGN